MEPRYSKDSEQSVLGGILLGGTEALDDSLATGLRAEDFYEPRHEMLFARCCDMAEQGQPIDANSLLAALSREERRRVGGAGVLADVLAVGALPASVAWHSRIVRDEAALRRLGAAGQKVISLAESAPTDQVQTAVERARAELDRVEPEKDLRVLSRLRDALPDAVERMSEEGPRGIQTGWADLDHLLQGLRPGASYVAGARPSVGKTMFAVNVAATAAASGVPTYLASLEMPRLDIVDRLISLEAGVPLTKIRNGRLTDQEWDLVAAANNRMVSWPILIDDASGSTISDYRSRLRRATRRRRLGLFILDYLQLVEPRDLRVSREQQVAEISRGLKAIAKDFGCPVLTLAQLSRETERRRDSRPVLADLRESGAIENDADVVMLLHPPRDAEGEIEVLVAKNRQGETGKVELLWRSAFMTIQSKAYL